MSTWSHLPNAKYIDRILESAKENPNMWDVVSAKTWQDGTLLFEVDNKEAYNLSWTAAYEATRTSTAHFSTRISVRGCVVALTTYPECAYLLDEKPEHVKFLADLGMLAAKLLYPACLVLSREKNE